MSTTTFTPTQSSGDTLVISGIGVLSSLGRGPDRLWESLSRGRSGVQELTDCRDAGLRSWLGARVDDGDSGSGPGRRALRGLTRPEAMMLEAVHDAIRHAGLTDKAVAGDRTGLYFAGHKFTSDLDPMLEGLRRVRAKSGEPVQHADVGRHASGSFNPLFYVEGLQSLSLYNASRHWNVTGPCLYVHGTGDSGATVLSSAVRALRRGEIDVAVVAAAADELTPSELARIDAMGLLTTDNAAGADACRPYDRERAGSVLGEGAVALVIQRRGQATQWCAQLLGVGLGTDGTRAPAPDPDAKGVGAALRRALELADAEVGEPVEVSHVIGHGSATTLGDRGELRALATALRDRGDRVKVHSVKPQTGHLGSAAGLLNCAVSALALAHDWLPPTRNHREPDHEVVPPLAVTGGRLGEGVGVVITRGVEGQAGAVVLGG